MEKLLSSKLFIFAKCRKDSSPSDHNKPCCYSLVTAPHSQSQSHESFWSLRAKTKNKPPKKNQKYCYLTLKHFINPFQIKKLDFMTIILCPKFNQHNLSGPSSGGMFLLETKRKKSKKRKKRFHFRLKFPAPPFPVSFASLNQPSEVPQAGRLGWKEILNYLSSLEPMVCTLRELTLKLNQKSLYLMQSKLTAS